MSSSSKELSKFEKEKQKLIQEKCQGLLNEMLRDDDNKYCVDCDAKGPRWASWNLGIFLCIRCAGIHRNLGVHISRVKSVNLDSWTPEQVVTMQQMGNSRARAVYEANLPDNFRRPQTDVALENFIRAKYEHTKYIAQEWVRPPPPRVDWNAEVEEQIRKKKEKKPTDVVLPTKGFGKVVGSRLKPAEVAKKDVPVTTAPPPITTTTTSSTTTQQPTSNTTTVSTSSASDDLLGLVTDDPFASPVKSTNNGGGGGSDVISNDLGSVFTAAADTSGLGGKMSKESILSLYGSMGGGGGGGHPAPSLVQSNNPFAGASMFATSQQQGTYDNGFGGLINNTQAHQQQQQNPVGLSQLQQGLFSLNLGSSQHQPQVAPQPHQQQFPNSNLFATPQQQQQPPPQHQSNLNMLMMNNAAVVGAATTTMSPFGAFASAPGLVSSTGMPQPQFHQQNQFGLFQNGGGGGGGGVGGAGMSTTATTTTGGVGSTAAQNIDLLWK